MLRKLRRLRVPVCFYTCCSLFAILLFVSFNEDVKNLIQQNNHNRGNPSGPQNFPPSFSSFSSLTLHKNVASVNGNARPLISSIPSGPSAAGNDAVVAHQDQQLESSQWQQLSDVQSQRKSAILPVEPYLGEKRKDGVPEEEDAIQQYINDNFVGSRGQQQQQQQPVDSESKDKQTTQKEQETTNVISNLVKLAQQASNNPNAFININSLTGDTVNAFAGENNELSQAFMEAQSTTADTDLLYPGGDANSQVRKRERQWFMTGGDYFPTPPGGLASIFYPSTTWLASKPSNVDYANLWYDSNSGSDRVIEQLMFAIDDPINYANISWGFEGPTATTVRPTGTILSQEPDKAGINENNNHNYNNNNKEDNNNNREENFGLDAGKGDVAQSKKFALTRSSSSLARRNNDPAAVNNNLLLLPSSTYYGHHNGIMSLANGMSSSRDPRLGKIKTILLYYGLGMSWGSHITNGRQVFLQQKCPVNACRLTGNRAQLSKADIVVFKDVFMHPKIKRPPGQLWVMYMLECPLNTQNFLEKNAFNLTATYRHDSDIVTPYEKWVYFDDTVRSLPQAINYAEGKTKKVAWFVSNCVAKNNRLEYARELAKYIEVDIYGACGSHTCSRANAKQCFEMLSKNYKFYLAFENSNCRDYISEKFFVNGLGNNVLPIVMGAHPDDYKRVAPDRSYIHVDDFSSPKELAQYLHELDTNDDLYNEYFKWKGTGEFINTHFFCRLCAMAHYTVRSPRKPSHYEDFNRWWRGPNICTRQSWRSAPDIFAPENYESVISHSQH